MLLFSFPFVHLPASVWFSIPPLLLFGFRFEVLGDEMKGVVAMRKEICVPEASGDAGVGSTNPLRSSEPPLGFAFHLLRDLDLPHLFRSPSFLLLRYRLNLF